MKNSLNQEINPGDLCLCIYNKKPILAVIRTYPVTLKKPASRYVTEWYEYYLRMNATVSVTYINITYDNHLEDGIWKSNFRTGLHSVKKSFHGMDLVIKLEEEQLMMMFGEDIFYAAKQVQAEFLNALHIKESKRKNIKS